ncbi:hypothetical protein Q5M79_06340 [Acinetobacter baumannii]|nr:hypothetical protein [Acinetobacter baumannii]
MKYKIGDLVRCGYGEYTVLDSFELQSNGEQILVLDNSILFPAGFVFASDVQLIDRSMHSS